MTPPVYLPPCAQPAYTPSNITLGSVAAPFVDQASTQIAPWVMGALADMFLQGILTTQLTNYFSYKTTDPSYRRFTWLVILVTVLCLLKSTQNIYILWELVVTNFANPDVAAVLSYTYWWNYTTSFMTAIIAIVVQSFFVHRYWLLTSRLWISLVMASGMILSLVAAVLVVVELKRGQFPYVQLWSLVHFVSAIITDMLITCLTAYHLYRQKRRVYSTSVPQSQSDPSNNGLTTMELRTVQSTTNMINRLIWMIWQCVLPPTICVIINAVALMAFKGQSTHIAFNMVLPKLYAISIMYTLNLRNDMREERDSSYAISTHTYSHPVTIPPVMRHKVNPTGSVDSGGLDAVSGIGQSPGSTPGEWKGRNSSVRRLDVHVETVLTRTTRKVGDVESQCFQNGMDPIKSLKEGTDEEDDQSSWEVKK